MRPAIAPGLAEPFLEDSSFKSGRARSNSLPDRINLLADEAAPQTIGRMLPPQFLTEGATMRSTVFNLVSTCLGSGMLALPATLAKLGLAGGLFMLVLVPWLGERTTALMVVATELTGGETYTVVAERTLGRAGSVVTAAALIALNYGVCVSYLIVVKDLLPWELKVVLGVDVSGTLCLAAVAVVVLVPLSAMEKMDQLRYASVASVALTYAFVALVMYAGVSTFLRLSADEAAAWWSQQLFRGGAGDWLEAVPVVCFSYLCTQNVPYLFLELRRQSSWNSPSRYVSKRVKFQSSARVAMALCTLIYCAMAAGGFAAFGQAARPDLLENFQAGSPVLPDVLVHVLRIAFVLVMVTTFPSISFGLRGSLHTLAFRDATATAPQRWAESVLLVAAAVVLAVVVDDLGLVFQLMGSTCGALIMFILPAATYLRCKQRAMTVATSDVSASPSASKLLQVLDGERFGDDALVAWAILAFGCWVAVYNVASVAVARLQ